MLTKEVEAATAEFEKILSKVKATYAASEEAKKIYEEASAKLTQLSSTKGVDEKELIAAKEAASKAKLDYSEKYAELVKDGTAYLDAKAHLDKLAAELERLKEALEKARLAAKRSPEQCYLDRQCMKKYFYASLTACLVDAVAYDECACPKCGAECSITSGFADGAIFNNEACCRMRNSDG